MLDAFSRELAAMGRAARDGAGRQPEVLLGHGEGVPVVMVHGWMGHPNTLRPLADVLLHAGARKVHLARYGSITSDVPKAAEALDALLDGLGQVDLIGFSLGALISRWSLKRGRGARSVRRFVALAGPLGGTSMHPWAPSAMGRALDPHGKIVRALAEGPEPVPTTCIVFADDPQIRPHTRALLDGADNHALAGWGHNALIRDPRVAKLVVDALA